MNEDVFFIDVAKGKISITMIDMVGAKAEFNDVNFWKILIRAQSDLTGRDYLAVHSKIFDFVSNKDIFRMVIGLKKDENGYHKLIKKYLYIDTEKTQSIRVPTYEQLQAQIEDLNQQLAEARAKPTKASQTELNNLKMTVKAFIDYMANKKDCKYGDKPNISKIDLAICGTVHVADSTIKDVLDMCKDFEK